MAGGRDKLSQRRRDRRQLAITGLPPSGRQCRVSSLLDQARPAFSERPLDRPPLQIVDLQFPNVPALGAVIKREKSLWVGRVRASGLELALQSRLRMESIPLAADQHDLYPPPWPRGRTGAASAHDVPRFATTGDLRRRDRTAFNSRPAQKPLVKNVRCVYKTQVGLGEVRIQCYRLCVGADG